MLRYIVEFPPGSKGAIERGCACPQNGGIVTEEFRDGLILQYTISKKCGLHYEAKEAVIKYGGVYDADRPGSEVAIKHGCTCSATGNRHGVGWPTLGGHRFCIDENCPVHGKLISTTSGAV